MPGPQTHVLTAPQTLASQADPTTVLAHAFGDRYELPLPLVLFVIGGALTVLLSFVLVLRLSGDSHPDDHPGGHDPGQQDTDEGPPQEGPRVRARGVVSLAMAAGVAVVGLTGTQETSRNLAPTVFWVLFWIMVPLSCGVVGDWTRSANPFGVAARLGDSPRLRQQLLARRSPLPWPSWLGWWPAVALFIGLVLSELVFNLQMTKPAAVGTLIVLYLMLSAFAGLLYGPAWSRYGEVFTNLFDAWGRLGYRRFGAPGRRGFGGGLDVPFAASGSRVVFILLMLISINFDGLLATPQWARYELRLLGDGQSVAPLRVGSLALLIVVILIVFAAFARASARLGGHSRPWLADTAVLLPSLVPIAFGYLVAHYAQYALTNGQLLFPELGNPGYADWPLTLPAPFNDDYQVNTALLPNSSYWYASVAVIVAVHVAAVVIAHRALRARARDSHAALRSEYPWLVAMVGYTALSLFLIAQPLTEPSTSSPAATPPATPSVTATTASVPGGTPAGR